MANKPNKPKRIGRIFGGTYISAKGYSMDLSLAWAPAILIYNVKRQISFYPKNRRTLKHFVRERTGREQENSIGRKKKITTEYLIVLAAATRR
jgi:hypothetical protein